MPINLLNDKNFNDYLIDITYQGNGVPKQPNYHGDFESVDYVEQHRDEIIKGILNQYIKSRVREYVVNLENEPAFVLVDKNRTDLPGWTAQVFARGENVYEFNGALMSSKLRDEITEVRDFLYDAAGQYVDKVIRNARETGQKPKIRYDYLKTSNEFSTFEKALVAAKHWHEIMGEELAKRNKAKDFLEKSLKGAKKIMDLPDGLTAYELTTPEALDFESDNMGHCVGRGGYDAGVKDGSIKIYSIRDVRGEPHATLEVRGTKVYQIKGKANKALIHKYVPATIEFINNMGLDVVNDLDKIHAIKQDGKLWDIFNLPKGFVVTGDLDLSGQGLTELPDLSTITVNGNFHCSVNQLTSLKGAPQSVSGNFVCYRNQLTSLHGAPQSVGGDFGCSYNQLTSLEHAPQSVRGYFRCSNNQLTSLEHAPQSVGGDFDCSYNQLTSLNGAPQSVGGDFGCSHNQLTSLEHAPQSVGGDFDCSYNQLTSLNGAPQSVGGDFYCSSNQLTSLEHAPQSVGGGFNCSDNQLTSLKGAPQSVSGNFVCYRNQLTSLHGAPQNVFGDFGCSYNQLTSLEHAPQSVWGYFRCSHNQLTSLEHAPQNVGGDFNCSYNQLTSLEHAPQGVGRDFDCSHNQLTSLEHAPQSVGGDFWCSNNQLTSLNGAPQSVGGDFEYTPQSVGGKNNPISDSKSKNAFKAGIKKIKNKITDKFNLLKKHVDEQKN